MKHRLISLITALALCLSLCPPWALAAEASPGWTYDEENRTLTIESDEGCVNWCTTSDVDKANIQTVTISDGVTSIGDSAFAGCRSLTSIEIPDGVESIGNGAFEDCSSLTSIKIPSSVTSIEDRTFFNCTRLTQVEIPNSVTSIKDSAFAGCRSLTSIEIPDGVESIGNGAFAGCRSLTQVEIPDGVESIGNGAFEDCSSLTSIKIPSSVTSIEYRTFLNCRSLTQVEIPDGVESIGDGAFEDCSSLTSIKIPSSVTSIEDRTFFNCTRLTQVEIPNSVTSIKDSAFSGCSSLTSVEIPSSVTSIGVGVFVRCTGLKTLIYPGALKIVGVPTSTAQLAYTDDGNGGVIVEIVSEGQQADGNFIPENIGGKPVTSIKNCKQHTGGTATCVQKAVCSICREAYGDLAPHTFDNDGSCSVCQKQAGVKVENSDGTITYYGTINDVAWSEDPITLLADGVLPAHIGDYKLNLTVEQGVKLTIPAGHGLTAASLTNNGTIVNEGTIKLENAGSDDIKNLNLTGSGTVRVEDKVYENNGSELIGDLDFSSKDLIPTGDGYRWDPDTKTLTLSNVKIGGKVTLPDDTVTVKTEGQCSIGELTPPGYSGDPNPEKTKLTFTGPGTLTVQQGINLSGGDGNAITVDAGATVIANGRIVIGASGAVNSVVTVNGTLTVESTNNTALSAGMVTVGPSGKLSVSGLIGVMVNGMTDHAGVIHTGLFTIAQGGSFQATYTDHGLLHQDTSTLPDDLNAGDVFVIPSGYLPLDCEVQKSGGSIKLVKLGTSDPYPSPLTIHNHGWSWSYDASQHWQVCTNPTKCGSTYNQAPHSGSPCSVCGYSRPIDPPRPTYYRVTYASGGGQGTPPSGTQKTAGSRFRLAENSFTLAGWEFSGWEYDGKVYQPGELFTMPRRSVTFTAQWTELPPETYAVTFDPNGGSGSMDPGTATENVPFVLPACAYTAPEGQEFVTWAIGAENGPKVPPDGEYVFTENTTVYAIWKDLPPKPPETYAVTFDPNGGSGSMDPGTATEHVAFVLPACACTAPEGQEFDTWAIGSLDGPKVPPGGEFVFTENTTVYALWKDLPPKPPETYAVTFDPNGGSGSMDPGTATENVAFVLPACAYAAPKNHEFDTWAIGAPDGPKVPPDGEFVFTENTTVYALWKEIPQPPTPPTPPAASSPSGGGGSVVRYRITVEDAEYGAVEANCDSAASGTVIKLTAAADAGYALSELTVEDSRGQKIPVTDRLTFVMPNRDVTVAASFAPVPDQPCSGGYGCPSRPYQDLDPKAWYHAAVDAAIQRGLLAGFEDGTFRPGGLLTRGQLAQILYNQAGRPPVDGGGSFSDVPSGVWYASAVRWMAAQGIAGGYGDGRFGPDDSITREQLAVMLWRYFGSPAATAQTLQFSDAAQASGWAVDALLWASEKGVLKGKGGNVLDPKGLTTRGEAAQMLYPLS